VLSPYSLQHTSSHNAFYILFRGQEDVLLDYETPVYVELTIGLLYIHD